MIENILEYISFRLANCGVPNLNQLMNLLANELSFSFAASSFIETAIMT